MRTHLYRKPPKTGNYYVSYFVGGHRTRKSLGTDNYALARAMQKKLEQDLVLDKIPTGKRSISLVEFERQYFPYAENHKRPKTVMSDRYAWSKLTEKVAISHLHQFSQQMMEQFVNSLLEEGLKKSSVNVILRHLSSIFTQAVRWRMLGENPCKGLKKFKIHEKKIVYLHPEEIELILERARIKGRDIHLVFALGIYAGLRKNEIANARWEWFDFDGNVIHVVGDDGFETKSGCSRSIPLNSKLKEILLQYNPQPDGYLFFPDKIEWDNLTRYDFKKAFRSVCRDADLDWVTPHVLRHTFASRLAIAGVSLYKISQWLGHADFKTTQIYAHLQASDGDVNRI